MICCSTGKPALEGPETHEQRCRVAAIGGATSLKVAQLLRPNYPLVVLML
jgi:hypothetical protein